MFKLLFAMFGLCALFTSEAHAADAKLYSGTSCQSNSTSTPLYYHDGMAGNSSSASTLLVDCAVARDNTSSSSIRMYLIDQHYSSNISCYASSIQVGTAWSGWWTAVYSTSGTNSTAQSVSLGSISGNSSSWLHLTCSVPPTYSGSASGIQAYYVNET